MSLLFLAVADLRICIVAEINSPLDKSLIKLENNKETASMTHMHVETCVILASLIECMQLET